MTIVTTIINPHGQAGIRNVGNGQAVPGMNQIYPNIHVRTFTADEKPAGLVPGHSRITFAVDVCFVDGYMNSDGNHAIAAARVNPGDPTDSNGGSAWHGAIAGPLWGTVGKFMDEERRKTGNKHRFGGQDPTTTDGYPVSTKPITTYKWYRLVVDSVRVTHGTPYRMYAVRCFEVADELNNVLGPLLYQSQDFYIPEVGFADVDNVMFVPIDRPGKSDTIVGRIAAHISPASEYVSLP